MIRWLPLLLLACDNGVQSGVVPPGEGEACEEGVCEKGLVCSHENVCEQPGAVGTAVSGADCAASEECAYELECSSGNVCVEAGEAGTGGDGDTCKNDDDCQAGFMCDGGACVDLEVPFWTGGPCPADAGGDEDFKVLYQVPDLPTSETLDFFSMPFPNDLRLDSTGHPSFDGFPSPGADAPAVDALLSLVSIQSGWGLDPVVYFRFNKPQDLDSLSALTDGATVHFASIDDHADDYGPLRAFEFFTRRSRERYICQNWLAVTPYAGDSLLPNHKYAVWLTKGITSGGDEVFRDDDFPVLMQDERPTDATDAVAYDTFAPFRDYVDREGLARGEIVAATVFTTGDPARDLRYAREVSEAETTTVTVDQLDTCDASPCGRACVGASGLTEYHALVSIPSFTDADGTVTYTENYRPVVQGTTQVCAVLTVPGGEAPAAGWPVALWTGDLGTDAQDAAQNGIASAFAAEGVATLSIDLPQHGDRSVGGDPLAAWFQTESPAAWRGNLFQTFADGLVLQRLAADPLLGLDASEVWVAGQGVGGDAAVTLLAWGKELRGGVVGNAGGLTAALASERSTPYDVEHAVQRAFADTTTGRYHPVVSLLQEWLGALDPMGSAEAVVREPATKAKSVVFLDGVDDAEVGAESLHAVLEAASLPVAGAILDDFQGVTTGYPVYENLTTDDGKRTAVSVQVKGGHHALAEDFAAQAAAFIGSGAATGGAPTLEE